MKLAILIPAYNEETTLAQVIKTLPTQIPGIAKIEVVVVNDGSADRTKEIAQRMGATVISHWFNRGLGGALGTGFEYIRRHDFDLLITFDADGQHHPSDIATVVKPIVEGRADVVIGSRFLGHHGSMPWYRRIGIFGLNIITYLLFWTWTTDSQSGLRAFGRKAIQKIEIKSNKMEVSSEFFYEIQVKGLKLIEVPIQAIYTDYSMSKGQKNINGFNVVAKLIYRRFFAK
jgi:glycosyltransferase involved in cell wall biosynthesis